MSSFPESCFVRTYQALAHAKPERRQSMNDLLLAMREHRWLDFQSLSTGTLGLIVLVTYPGSSIRRAAWEALSQHSESHGLAKELAGLLHSDDSTVGRLAFFDDSDSQRADLLMEAFRSRACSLKKFICAWLNTDPGTELHEYLVPEVRIPRDEIGRLVGPTPEGLFHRVVQDVLSGLHFPEHATSLSALLLRQTLRRVKSMPSRDHRPNWLTFASSQEQTLIQRSQTLDDRERLILMAAVYGGISTEVVAEAMFDEVLPEQQAGLSSAVVLRELELEYAEKLRNAWRQILPPGGGA